MIIYVLTECACVSLFLTHLFNILTDKTGSEETSDEHNTPAVIGDQKPTKITTSSPFLDQDNKPVSISDTRKWTHSDNWDAIICADILVSRKELLQLLAEKLQISRNQDGMRKVAKCIYSINGHVTVTTVSKMKLHYWGSGTYNCVGRKSSAWQTWVEVEGCDRYGSCKRLTSRLAFVVCAIHLKNIHAAIGIPLARELRELDNPDSATFFLIRYAAPHRSATRRGPEHRPLCPGPLKNTHCLWTWASRPESHTRGCFRTRPWSRHRRHFGSTPDEQEKRKESTRRAWYDLIQVTNIKNYANVQLDPDPNLDGEVFLQSRVWSS